MNIFQVLKSSVSKVRREAILSMFFVACESIFEIIIPLAMASLIDRGIENGDVSSITKYSGVMFLLIIGEISCGYLCAKNAITASTHFALDLRSKMFAKIQSFAFANIDKFSTGSLVTRSTTDIANIQRAFQMVIRGIIRCVGMVIFALVFAFSIDSHIATYFLLMIPIVVGGFLFVSKLAIPMFDKMFIAFDDLNNVISENIHGIRVVKSFNREDFEYDKMKRIAYDIFKYAVKAESYVALGEPFIDLVVYAIIVCIAWFGSKAILASGNDAAIGLTTGKLMSLITYGMTILMSLVMMCMIYVMLVISSASMKRIKEVLLEESEIVNKEHPVYEVKNGDIKFENVSFKYKKDAKNYVLKNINIDIKEGQTIGIIGGTGSGKSSFVNLIPRLYDVTEGRLLVGGVDVRDYDIRSLRDKVGIVLQKNVLFSGTIASNLRFGNENATEEDMENACDIAGALEFIKEKPDRFNSEVEQNGNNFSGGQKQRLSIARTILKKPYILIFDDSTSAVDTKTDAKIRDGLKNRLPNTTKIIISQRIISLVSCDKIIVLDNGYVVAFDTHENLLKTCEIYKDINDLQNNK